MPEDVFGNYRRRADGEQCEDGFPTSPKARRLAFGLETVRDFLCPKRIGKGPGSLNPMLQGETIPEGGCLANRARWAGGHMSETQDLLQRIAALRQRLDQG